MAYLGLPSRRGSLFQNDKSAHKLLQARLQQKTEEYYNRNTRASTADDEEKVTLNIGGKRFITRRSTLRNVPGTKLAELDPTDTDHYDQRRNEYFFDRNPAVFAFILDYYRYGTMHIPRNICTRAIKDELNYWELKDGCISDCCRKFYFDTLDEFATYEMVKAEFYCLPTYVAPSPSNIKVTGTSAWTRFQEKAWVFIDNHESSFPAKIFAAIYYGLIVLSILSVFIGTLPDCRVPVFPADSNKNGTDTSNLTEPHVSLFIIESVCLFTFTIEFIFRLIVSPSLKARFKSWYTLTDILYFIPAWSRFWIEVTKPRLIDSGFDHSTFVIVLDAMMAFRVFRLFRLSRHYRGLRVLLLAIKASFSELFLLFIFVSFSLTIYASFIYSAEHYVSQSKFEQSSIFIGLWWALVTMTTVGYGDFVPISTVGYIVAAMTALTGILIIGMVVPIIAGNFHLYYGFRHAGSEDVQLEKPEFIPTEKDNPVPSEMVIDIYKPKTGGGLFTNSLKVTESHDGMDDKLLVKKSRSMVHSRTSVLREESRTDKIPGLYTDSRITTENGHCAPQTIEMDDSNVCNSPKPEKRELSRVPLHKPRSAISSELSIMEVSE